MADENTNVSDTTDVSGQTNDNEDTTGAGSTDNSKDKNQEEKTLKQSEVNEVVKRAKSDAERAAKTKFEKSLEGKHVLTDEEYTKLRTDIENEVRTKLAMENKRAEYKNKGLSDVQLDAVQVDKVEDYDARVNELYGALFKKDAPVLNGGKNDESANVPSTFLQRQQQKLNQLKKQNHLK